MGCRDNKIVTECIACCRIGKTVTNPKKIKFILKIVKKNNDDHSESLFVHEVVTETDLYKIKQK